jgi:hypothetical protein
MSGVDSDVKPPYQPSGESHVHGAKTEKSSNRRTFVNAVNEFFHNKKVSTAKKVAAVAIAASGAAGAAGIAHHATGFEFPQPIPPIAGTADKVESWAASLAWPSGDAEKLQKYEGIQQWAENFTDGEVFVPIPTINEFNIGNRHITTFGGAQVSENAAGYYIEDPAYDLNIDIGPSSPDSRVPVVPWTTIVVQVGYSDETTGLILIRGSDPMGAVGVGINGTIITRQAMEMGTIDPDGSISRMNGQQFSDASVLSRARVATATPPPVIPGP